MTEQEDYTFHCEVGDHDVNNGTLGARCAHCNRVLCFDHQGNPDTLPGNYVACVDHVTVVEEMQRKVQER
jgi:hypothetical protein